MKEKKILNAEESRQGNSPQLMELELLVQMAVQSTCTVFLFQCAYETCEYASARKYDVIDHMKVVHKDPKETVVLGIWKHSRQI